MAFINQEGTSECNIGFKAVQLFKEQTLGIGSYGAVCKAKCDDLLCAAKILHPTLFDPTAQQDTPQQRLHRQPFRRFELECEFLSAMKHPNIVQFLAFCRDSSTGLPVILMELMDNNLTNFLGDSTEPVPYHIQVNLCHDVIRALSFLHSNDIIHRDLSSNNVLLFSNIRAKVSDFGMARLGDLNPHATQLTLTMCPGTDVYMPPEAVEDKPVYCEKIVCFSFGEVVLQIMTQQFPKPGDRRQRVKLDHPGLPAGTLELRVSELDRRQNHITQVDPSHPLLLVVLDCLKDTDEERPSARRLCQTLATLKESLEYSDSVRATREKDRTVTEKDREIESLKEELAEQRHHLQQITSQLEEREMTLSAMKEDVVKLDRQLELEMREKKQTVDELNCLRQQFRLNEVEITEFQKQLNELNPLHPVMSSSGTLPRARHHHNEQNVSLGRDKKEACKSSMMLRWKVGKSAPLAMCRWSDAVVSGTTVYFKNGYSPEVHGYDSIDDVWFQLVDCRYQDCSLVIVNNLLTAVGGWNSNQIFSLLGESPTDSSSSLIHHVDDDTMHWAELFPPMLTKRHWTTNICTDTFLIVAGGDGPAEEEKSLTTVEVMDINTLQWSTAADLPNGVKMASITLCHDRLYLLGGKNRDGKSSTMILKCSLKSLLQSCRPQSTLGASDDDEEDSAGIWSTTAWLVLMDSAFVSVGGQLLAVGGRSLEDDGESDSYSTAVNLYHPEIDSWEVISHMSVGRSSCFAATLPDNQIMVVGGIMINDFCTKTVKFATVV